MSSNEETVYSILTNMCVVCGKAFGGRVGGKYCSAPCRQKGSNEKTRLQNQEKFLKEHGDDPLMPICKECGWKAFDLITHITKFHKIPMKEYYTKHNCDQYDVFHPDQLATRQERMVGDKNPGFEHGGKFSSISRNFVKYEGLSEAEKEHAIKTVQTKQADSREKSDGYQTRLSYWLTRGYTREESILKVQERQRTFSLDICIRKYGEDKGKEIWNARQALWLDTLYSNMTDEEYADLNRRKTSAMRNRWSRVAFTLFEELKHPEAVYASDVDHNEAHIIMNDGTEFTYPVDYMLGNKVIEFYGDQIHANPNKYVGTDQTSILHKHNAQYLWDRDAKKQKIIRDNGYDLLVVWEHDYKWNKEATIQKCKDFLGL